MIAMDNCNAPPRFHRPRRAHWVSYALASVALTLLTGCQAPSSSSIVGRSGIDSLLENDSYVSIPAGEFLMGSPNQPNHHSRSARPTNAPEANERPQHRVSITKPFEMGKYEVTQEQWQAVMGSNPSSFKGLKLPVTNVSWNDVTEFIARLQSFDHKHTYRLPTEAEWEYACRAGDSSSEEFKPPGENAPNGTPEEDEKILQTLAWFNANAFNHPHPVGQLKPNAWGLFDMRGNVREWCQDWYDASYYKTSPAEDPQGPPRGAMKVNRGGSWQSPASRCRSAARRYDLPTERNSLIGFRLVRVRR
jgi:formylglycine-generating enzyme required for sulfatase activity